MIPKRYEIYFADLNPTLGAEMKKIRPVVIVSQNEMNRYLETLVVCPLTSSIHPQWRSRVRIMCQAKKSEVAVDQIRAVSKQRLKKKIGRLSPEEGSRLRETIVEMYGRP